MWLSGSEWLIHMQGHPCMTAGWVRKLLMPSAMPLCFTPLWPVGYSRTSRSLGTRSPKLSTTTRDLLWTILSTSFYHSSLRPLYSSSTSSCSSSTGSSDWSVSAGARKIKWKLRTWPSSKAYLTSSRFWRTKTESFGSGKRLWHANAWAYSALERETLRSWCSLSAKRKKDVSARFITMTSWPTQSTQINSSTCHAATLSALTTPWASTAILTWRPTRRISFASFVTSPTCPYP